MSLEDPRAQYRQLADLLRAAIERGDYPAGSRFPSEPELAERHGVGRLTVNKAVSILRSQGLVRVERGRGTIVRELPLLLIRESVGRQRPGTRDAGEARGAFQAEMERLGLAARSEVDVSEVASPEDVAELLAIGGGEPVLARRRRMFANDVPVQLATSYLPLDVAAGTPIAETDTGPGGTYSRLAELGHAPAVFRESVRVRPADEGEARFFRMDADQRVMVIRRVARTATGRIIEVNDMVLPAHQWALEYEWDAEPAGG